MIHTKREEEPMEYDIVLIDNVSESPYILTGLDETASTATEAETKASGAGYFVNEGKTRLDAPEPGMDEAWLVRVTV